MGRFHSKVVYQQCVFSQILETIKIKSMMPYIYRLQIKQVFMEHFLKKFKVLIIRISIESLLYLTLSQANGKLVYHLKPPLAQKVHTQLYSTCLFSSVIIAQLLPAVLKSGLQYYFLLKIW